MRIKCHFLIDQGNIVKYQIKVTQSNVKSLKIEKPWDVVVVKWSEC